jgi:hypothetical protein
VLVNSNSLFIIRVSITSKDIPIQAPHTITTIKKNTLVVVDLKTEIFTMSL